MNRQQKNDKTEDKKSKRTCQKNKRGDTKGDSNDSPEIPDRVKSVCGGGGEGGGRHRTSLAPLWREGYQKYVILCIVTVNQACVCDHKDFSHHCRIHTEQTLLFGRWWKAGMGGGSIMENAILLSVVVNRDVTDCT